MFTLFTLPDHPNSHSIFSGVGVAQSIAYCQVFGTSFACRYASGVSNGFFNVLDLHKRYY